MIRLILILNILISIEIYSQCNGQIEVCSKPYDQVAFLTTHNAFNTGSESFLFPNQNFGIADQLQDGVRAFMLDVYDFWGNTVVYHGSWSLGYQDIQDDLGEVKTFLDSHPNEVVTLILECYVSSGTIESELTDAGLMSYLYTKIDGQPWSTMQEIIDANQRLVIFTDQDDASANQGWYHYMWDHMVETHYSVSSPQDFTETYNRGDSLNELFVFNHFVTDATLGTGSESDALIVNEYSFLMNRVSEHFSNHHKFPNFVTLDFYDQGEGLNVVNNLNAGYLKVESVNDQDLTVYPNPVQNQLVINIAESHSDFLIELYNLEGQRILKSNEKRIDFSKFTSGVYVVRIYHADLTKHFKVVKE